MWPPPDFAHSWQAPLNEAPGQVRGEADADTAYRTSLMEGVRDLAVIEALLASNAQGGSAVPVHQGELEEE